MTLGLKRGFLASKKDPNSSRALDAKPILGTATAFIPVAVEKAASESESDIDFRLSETCRPYSENIIEADYRNTAPEASHFLYLPQKNAAIVFLDHLPNILKISRWDIWKKPPLVPQPDPPFVLKQSSDKGIRMVARRSISKGELIAIERPLVVSRTDVAIAEDQSTTGVFYRAALSGLSPAARKAFMSLHNCFGSEEEPILGTLLTNYQTVVIPEVPESEYSGLFPTLCRANHDCSPNANFFFHTPTFTGRFNAVRPIAKDEEITALYCELAAPREARRAELLEHYKFICECKTCTLPPDLAEKSDNRRRAISEIIPLMHQGIYADDMTMARIQELLDWATREGLYALYAEILVYGYGLAVELRDPDNAFKWSQMARTAFTVLDGADSPRVNN
ncbi:hypothetical protein B0H11DRAFT_1853932 [Mycena galericulata]|nr:hypothetical protein B0H11DRAFT_1853932 [Mycena galericulata]